MNITPDTAHVFWSALSQLVAVFGLALVIEGRRSAALWVEASKPARWASAIGWVTVAIALVVCLVFSLVGMVSTSGMVDALVPSAVTAFLVFVILVANPVLDLFFAGTSDLFGRLGWLILYPLRLVLHQRIRSAEARTSGVTDMLADVRADLGRTSDQIVKDLAENRSNMRRARRHVAGLLASASRRELNGREQEQLNKLHAFYAECETWQAKAREQQLAIANDLHSLDDAEELYAESARELETIKDYLAKLAKVDADSVKAKLQKLTFLESAALSQRPTPPTATDEPVMGG